MWSFWKQEPYACNEDEVLMVGPKPICCHEKRGKPGHIQWTHKEGGRQEDAASVSPGQAGPESPSVTEASYPPARLSWTPSLHNSNVVHLCCLRHLAVEVVTSGDTVQLHPHRALRELVVWSPLPEDWSSHGLCSTPCTPGASVLQSNPGTSRSLEDHRKWPILPHPSLFPRSTPGRRQH